MEVKKNYRIHRPLWHCLWILVLLLFACASEDQFAGVYHAEDVATPDESGMILELKEGGEGIWRTEDDEVSFSWYLKKGELRINTKDGGVLVGKIQGETIDVTLPGDRRLSFKKAP